MRIVPSIFPNPRGNLVIGAYPHKMTNQDAAKLSSEPRKPYLAIEMVGAEMVCRAAGDTPEHCLAHVEGKSNRWLVFPVDYSGSSDFIYR